MLTVNQAIAKARCGIDEILDARALRMEARMILDGCDPENVVETVERQRAIDLVWTEKTMIAVRTKILAEARAMPGLSVA